MEIPEQTWLLVARNLSGEASEAERKELAEILRKDEQLQQHYDLLTRVWIEKHNSLQKEDGVSARETVSRIISKAASAEPVYYINETAPIRPRIMKRRIWMAAASVLVVISAGFFWFRSQSSPGLMTEVNQGVLEAQKGSRSRSVLPDGSTVWLNAGSKLYYENDFTGATREVKLDGEAYFDIVKKTNRPFIVHTSGIDIKVLGTAFNVKSYPEDKTVETTLFRGSVRVFRHEETERQAIQLKPNEKLTLVKEAAATTENVSDKPKALPAAKAMPAISTIAHIDSTKKEDERIETAWIYNRLEFRGDNFEELARKLERWYNVTIAFNDEKVKGLSFNGTFDRETVEQAFAYLKLANPLFNYKISNHEIFVGSNR